MMASEQLVKHRAESVDIRGVSDTRVISYRLFRRHVTGRAQNFHRARDSALRLDQPCQPEIGEVWFAFCVEQNVSGFDVSMEDAVLMRIGNRAGQLGDQFRCVTDRHRFALRDGIELAAIHQSHAEVTDAAALPDFVNRNNAWMLKAGSSFCFETETLDVRSRGPPAKPNDFQRDDPIKTLLPRPINHPLTAPTNFLHELVVAELHLRSSRLLPLAVPLIKRTETGSKQTQAAKSAWRIAKYGRRAFCAHALNSVSLGDQSRSSLLCTDRNSLRSYA